LETKRKRDSMKLVLLTLLMASLAHGLLNSNAKRQFGRHLLTEFAFADGYINLNHGSFGSTPREVLAAHSNFIAQMEAMPDIWFRAGDNGYRAMVIKARATMAEYLNATDPDDLVLVENASAGVNAVLRSIKYNPGDKVLITSTAYPMVKNLLTYLAEKDGIEVVQVPLVFPLTSDDDILIPVAQAIAQHGSSIKIASFSHIDSVPGFILPVAGLNKLCQSAGIRVLIDGAHAIGQIPINLRELDVDYYVTNGHKWFYSPKGTAILYVRKQYQQEIAPTVVGSEWKMNNFAPNFEYTGTRDYTGFVTLEAALNFRNRFGDLQIMSYLHELAWFAGNYLAAKWNTGLLVPEHMCGSLIDIELPLSSMEEAEALRAYLFQVYNTYFIVHQLQNKIYTRLSAQIYLEEEDFILFGDRVLEFLNKKKL